MKSQVAAKGRENSRPPVTVTEQSANRAQGNWNTETTNRAVRVCENDDTHGGVFYFLPPH
ncbi:hypothetical protein FACS1894202_00640 [Clostridia bacterium]|nr:hypothetical protein FACS1894202_00640 [Clostridia bacterium]